MTLVLEQEQLEALRSGMRSCRMDTYVWELAMGAVAVKNDDTTLVATDERGETEVQFDEAGCPSELRLANGRRYKLEHDAAGHLVRVAWSGGWLELSRDVSGRIVRARSSGGDALELAYDGRDRVVKMSASDGTESVFEYDGHGWLKPASDARLVLDEQERLMAVKYGRDEARRFKLDEGQGVAALTRRDGKRVLHRLAGLEAIKRVDWPDGGFVELDWQGDCLVAAHTAKSWVTMSWGHNGTLVVEASPSGAARYDYDAYQRLATITLSNGETIRYAYDDRDRVTEIEAWGTQQRIRYEDDQRIREIGDLALIETHRHGRLELASVQRGRKVLSEQTFRYDDRGRLTAQESTGTAQDTWGEQMVYDDEGHLRTVRGVGAAPSMHFSWEESRGVVRHEEVEPILYDVSFNDDGTMASTTVGNLEVEYAYDSLGRRLHKRAGSTEWRYGWSRHQLLFEEQSSPSGKTRRDYLYMPEGLSPIAFREKGRVYWLQHDARGAVVRLFRTDGALGWRARYDALGHATVDIEHIRQPFRLAGQYADHETGLHHAVGRYYDPVRGAYCSAVTDVATGADRYAYAQGDPYNRVDVVGLTPARVATEIGQLDLLSMATRLESELFAADDTRMAASAGVAAMSALTEHLPALTKSAATMAESLVWSRMAREAAAGDPLRLLETTPPKTSLHRIVWRATTRQRKPFSPLRQAGRAMHRWAR